MDRQAPLIDRLGGLLFFPVTAFGADGSFAPDAYREHVRHGVEAGAGAVFAACGTGEYHALDLDEYEAVVAAAVEATGGRVPVLAGVGHGTALASRFAERAERAGAEGLLAMPPYLVLPDQEGLVRHFTALAGATGLDLIVYQRDNAVLSPESVLRLAAEVPQIIGLKDGLGDLDLMQRIVSALRTDAPERPFRYFNGLPTAELTGLAYRGIGVTLYSSAAFAFAPDVALAFHDALVARTEEGDALVNDLLDAFYRPLVELRNTGRGFAVSLVKAGVRQQGLDVGGVRPPLTDPGEDAVKALAEIVARGRAVLSARGAGVSG
jgi:5-dehydro-4-deoxyglucarate dehydratase